MYRLTVVILIGVKDDMGQSPLDTALDSLSNSNCVDIAYYLIVECGYGGEEEKMMLLCRACYHGKLDMVKKLVLQHNIDPNGE